MELLSIGEFARQSRLSLKALRLYDELGLLPPARVDSTSGYRFYAADQLEPARLVSALRQIDMPLAEIKTVLALEPPAASVSVERYWSRVESKHTERRELARRLIDRLNREEHPMYDVATRQIPERSLLCLKRHVNDYPAVWAVGKEFTGLLQKRPMPQGKGRAEAGFLIYHGEVSDDSDGPIEWCRPVPGAQAEEFASWFPELTLRIEPAHEEAFVSLGTAEVTPAQWQLVSDATYGWSAAERRPPSPLGLRITFLVSQPRTADRRPDLDFAVPLMAPLLG